MKLTLFLCLVLLPMLALAQFPSSSVGISQPGGNSNSQSVDNNLVGSNDDANDDDDVDDDDTDEDATDGSVGMDYGSSSNFGGVGGPQLLSSGGKAGIAIVAIVGVGAVAAGVAFFMIRRG